MKKLQYTCVEPADEEELGYICENMDMIGYKEFSENVDSGDFEHLKNSLGYFENTLPKFENDWSIQYGSCYLPKKNVTAYIVIWSAIEHIFY